MEALSVSVAKHFTGCLFDHLPKSLGAYSPHSALPLPPNLTALIFREDPLHPHTQVNVYSSLGDKLYTISRHFASSYNWYIYSPQHLELAQISIGLFDREVIKPDTPPLKLEMGSGIRGKLHRHFHDSQGQLFIWSRRSNYLEKVSNPHGAAEEVRERCAYARNVRKTEFEWQLLVNPQDISILDAVTTAFIMMKSQWSTTKVSDYPLQSPPESPQPVEAETVHRAANLYDLDLPIYEDNDADSSVPTNFFSPPGQVPN